MALTDFSRGVARITASLTWRGYGEPMRRLVVFVLVAGCTDAQGPDPLPEGPPVIVHVGFSTAQISFIGLLAPAVLEDGVYTLFMAPDSSIRTSSSGGSSPTSQSTYSTTLAGVMPGDELWFGGEGAPMEPRPAACVCERVLLTATDEGSTWDDPDPSAIDARLTQVATTITMPYWPNWSYTIIDGIADNHVGEKATPYEPYPTGPPVGVSVTTLKCDGLSYDDIRARVGWWFDCTQ